MYLPKHFALEDRSAILEVLRATPFGHLVTGADGDLTATPLPFLVDDDLTTVRAHFSKANPHWRSVDGAEALLIVPTVDTYISPRWYPSKAEHGTVVPTWNYEVIHLRGTVEIHQDDDWKLRLVSDLTDVHERAMDDAAAPGGTRPWQVSDAPDDFVAGQLRAIVGVQVNVTEVIGKQKLSQNRTEQDQAGVVAGLGRSTRPTDLAVVDKMNVDE